MTSDEREWLGEVRAAEGLSDLVGITGADSEHDAYFEAKREWNRLRRKEFSVPADDGIPGSRVVVDGHEFHVHGATHADTREEGDFLREHVSRFREQGATVYCEQGIRSMYFPDFPDVCQMDDYRWAMAECAELGVESRVPESRFDGVVEDVDSLTTEFPDAAFSLIDSVDDGDGATTASSKSSPTRGTSGWRTTPSITTTTPRRST